MADIDIVRAMQPIAFHEVDASRWDDLERLFESLRWTEILLVHGLESRGKKREGSGPESGDETHRGRRRPHRVAGVTSSAGEPVAWCSIAPRPTYRDLGGPTDVGERPEEVWSLACFFIRRALRGKGLTRLIIEAAVQHAAKRGAKVVEAYPVEPGSPKLPVHGRRADIFSCRVS